MNRNKLKTYAPAARREFIQAVTDRAHFWGLSETGIEPMEESGDLAIIGGRPFPRAIAAKRHKLEEWIRRESFPQVMEAIAYTWFNRFMALRYMEVNDFLEHGCRVLSNPGNSPVPEILDRAAEIALPGLSKEKVIELKMDGGKDAELYRMFLVAQCNALHAAMPYLFERIDDETELLLPDNLLHSDSLIRKLVTEIDEEDWKEVEIIGWLYQFYISEKKDEVFEGLKKNQKITPENIPAATQLFTPHWIVRYIVENSLGRLWMLNRPNSRLVEQMGYFIKPEQPESNFLHIVKPEEIKICDPACGSGHMLVYAFDLLHAIYEEEGYEPAEIPEKILTHNLYGIEIDERAGELAAFALTMKARAKQLRFFRKPVHPNTCVLENIQFDEGELKNYMDFVGRDLFTAPLHTTLRQFEEADNFGSLIRPDVTDVAGILKILESKDVSGQLFLSLTHQKVMQALQQAGYLGPKYHVVIANPPYMRIGSMNPNLREFAQCYFPISKPDLFSMFIERNLELVKSSGFVGMITMQSWMFLTSFEILRRFLVSKKAISSMAHLGARAFDTIGGEVVSTTAFVLQNFHDQTKKGSFLRLVDGNSEAEKESTIKESINSPYLVSGNDFLRIPACPIAYWVSEVTRNAFSGKRLDEILLSEGAVKTGNNTLYLRQIWEVEKSKVSANGKWRKHPKGGEFRKWYGNMEWVVDWTPVARKHYRDDFIARIPIEDIWNIHGITWTSIASNKPSFRILTEDEIANNSALFVYTKIEEELIGVLCYLNSIPARLFLNILNPTIQYLVGDVMNTPLVNVDFTSSSISKIGSEALSIQKADWDGYETSWDFNKLPLLHTDYRQSTLKATYQKLRAYWQEMTMELQQLEEENNRIFIDASGLQNELTPVVPLSEITLTCNPHYHYGGDKNKDELEALLLTDTMKELISYAVGCLMGRYSLDQPGLVYANSENVGFDPAKYEQFPADDDGIVPIMDMQWFPDDAACRFEEFMRVAWSPETLEEKLKFVAAVLSPKGGETPRETIRRYISTQFFKDHLQTYKKRPIYWLFSSGKQRAFECLVYLHRYNESTLSRMRNQYVTPLQGKFAAQIDFLSNEIGAATSTAERNRLQKQLETLKKKKDELASFDELLRHYADQRIALDLDEGVKVNYGKFGNLLADVKVVTGAGE